MEIVSQINFWSALSGFLGSMLIFFFGIPPRIDPNGHIYLIAEQEDEDEKCKARLYKRISYLGVFLLGFSFMLQLLSMIMQ